MAVNKPRNRTVIFRLTQDEYKQLETISSAGGARSLSEFARSRVLYGNALYGNAVRGNGEPSLAEIEKKLDELAGAVQGLARILVKS
jgi:hypothetical protein